MTAREYMAPVVTELRARLDQSRIPVAVGPCKDIWGEAFVTLTATVDGMEYPITSCFSKDEAAGAAVDRMLQEAKALAAFADRKAREVAA